MLSFEARLAESGHNFDLTEGQYREHCSTRGKFPYRESTESR